MARMEADIAAKDSHNESLKTELVRAKAELSPSQNFRQQVALMAEQSNVRDRENNDKICKTS